MNSLLLKKTLPFALTFVIGSLAGGLFNSFGVGGRSAAPARTYFYGYGEGHGRSCRMRARQRYLVAESKPLAILFKPDARLPDVFGESWRVEVTFGADGNVLAVEPFGGRERDTYSVTVPKKWEAVESAARQIQFTPETVNGIPVTVTREVEIHLMPE
jgi:hypothetical protein